MTSDDTLTRPDTFTGWMHRRADGRMDECMLGRMLLWVPGVCLPDFLCFFFFGSKWYTLSVLDSTIYFVCNHA